MPAHRRSIVQHTLAGTYRKDRHGRRKNAAKAADSGPARNIEPPAYLQGRPLEIWRSTAPACVAMATLTAADVPMLAVWCSLAAEFEASPATMKPARLSQLRALARDFGLVPVARAALAIKPPRALLGDDIDPVDGTDEEDLDAYLARRPR